MSAPRPIPLTRFGPIGWLAAGVGLALLIAIFRGVDVQTQLLRAIDAVAGWPGVYWFVSRPLASMAYSLFDPIFGFVPLAGLLITARIVPRRPSVFAQWLAVACSIVGAAGLINAHILLTSLFGGPQPWFLPGYQTLTLLIAFTLAVFMFRSKAIAWSFGLAIGLPSLTSLLNQMITMPELAFARPGQVLVIRPDFAVLVLLTLAAPVAWAVRYRRLNPVYPDSACHTCGYAREGLPPDALCPECGHPLASTPAAPSPDSSTP